MKIKQLKEFPYKIILGSASPRRQQLLRDMGFDFKVEVINADESFWPEDLKKEEIAKYLARKKAASFHRDLKNDELLITADTIVWRDGRVFNKPADTAEATGMLRTLSGGSHFVYTGVCLKTATKEKIFAGASEVFFKDLGDDEIAYYIEHNRPFDKAGSYGVQDWLGYTGITKIDGSFYNVMGLPVQQLYEELLMM